MPRYKVHVCRTGYGHAIFEVDAKNKEEAKEFALEEAYNHVFSDNDSEYSVESVSKLTGDERR